MRFASVVAAAALFVFAVGAGGCTSAFPPGSFDWGHGAKPLQQHATRVVVGGGGGLGVGIVGSEGGGGGLPPTAKYDTISGGGGGVAVEHQLLPTLLLRAEGGGGCQSPTTFTGASIICPVAVYGGAQLNPGDNQSFALRLRVGGGGDFFDDVNGAGVFPAPYIATQGALVFSGETVGFEPFLDLHGGVKVGALLAPVTSVGVSGGTTYALTDSLSLYGLARSDLLFVFVLPSLTANVQAGLSFTF